MTDFSKTEINVDKKDYSNYRILIISTSWNKEIIDVMQEDAISKLKGLIPNKYRLWENVIAFFYTKKNNKKGIYLWGKAGSGKTMIMDMCFSISNITEKRRIHFQEFMIDIHNRLHEIRKNISIKDPLLVVAKEISSEVKFLCFDEFQVNDIADASIIYKLFKKYV